MNQDTFTLVGAIGGSAIEVLGGVVGTWFSIRNTNGPRERCFVVRASVLCWLAGTAFLGTLWFTPFSFQAPLWLPYMAALHPAIHAWNRRQDQIRKEDFGTIGSRGGTV
jgi:hypothetical protein